MILPVRGVVSNRKSIYDFFGGTSTELLGQWFDRAMADPEVGAVVMDIDSPGGSVFGLPELHAKIMGARGGKPIIAVANAMAASAAYYIASAADEVVVTPSGWIGSVGTIMLHLDWSKALDEAGIKPTFVYAGKFKSEGNSLEPLDDEAKARMQEEVDGYYEQFVGDVAKGRGITKAAVKRDYGQGRMFLADEAIAAGVADRVASMEEVLTELGVAAKPTQPAGGRAEGTDPAIDIRRRRTRLREITQEIQSTL